MNDLTPNLPDIVAEVREHDLGFRGLGWRVITAHVSTMNAAPLW